MTDRYKLPDPKCRHMAKRFRVTAGDLDSGPHASVLVCEREACIADAEAWARASTGLDSERFALPIV